MIAFKRASSPEWYGDLYVVPADAPLTEAPVSQYVNLQSPDWGIMPSSQVEVTFEVEAIYHIVTLQSGDESQLYQIEWQPGATCWSAEVITYSSTGTRRPDSKSIGWIHPRGSHMSRGVRMVGSCSTATILLNSLGSR